MTDGRISFSLLAVPAKLRWLLHNSTHPFSTKEPSEASFRRAIELDLWLTKAGCIAFCFRG
jgi:hypothetical protein